MVDLTVMIVARTLYCIMLFREKWNKYALPQTSFRQAKSSSGALFGGYICIFVLTCDQTYQYFDPMTQILFKLYNMPLCVCNQVPRNKFFLKSTLIIILNKNSVDSYIYLSRVKSR